MPTTGQPDTTANNSQIGITSTSGAHQGLTEQALHAVMPKKVNGCHGRTRLDHCCFHRAACSSSLALYRSSSRSTPWCRFYASTPTQRQPLREARLDPGRGGARGAHLALELLGVVDGGHPRGGGGRHGQQRPPAPAHASPRPGPGSSPGPGPAPAPAAMAPASPGAWLPPFLRKQWRPLMIMNE